MSELVYRGHRGSPEATAWSPDGRRIASASFVDGVHVWDANTGARLLAYVEGNPPIAWSPDGRWIAADRQGPIRVFDASTGQDAATYTPQVRHAPKAFGLAWAPDGARAASSGGDGIVALWEGATGRPLVTFRGHAGSRVEALAWSPDGDRIASADVGGAVRIWDARPTAVLPALGSEYRPHANSVLALAWSPDGTRIVSAGGLTTAVNGDNSVQVWRASDGGRLFSAGRHDGPVYAVAWSPDGTRVASASFDRTVLVADASTGKPLFTYREHAKPVLGLAWSPDGRRIASAGQDGMVRVWQPQ